jgi:hypothetical protein
LTEGLRAAHEAHADVIARDFPNGRKLLFYRPYTETSFRTPDEVVSNRNFGRLEETVSAVRKLTEERGVKLVVVLVPAKEEVYSWVWKGGAPWSSDAQPSGFSVALARVCAGDGIKFIDLKPELIDESKRAYEGRGQLLYWYDDTHLNVTGNVFTASVIHSALARGDAAQTRPRRSRP